MRTELALLAALGGFVCCHAAQPGLLQDLAAADAATAAGPKPFHLEAVTAPGYATATAGDPHYQDARLWPVDTRKSAHARQEWPKTRVLVWAKPGVSAKDGWDAKYWLEDGQAATKPFDENTDLVFPDSPKGMAYISLTSGRKYQPAAFRHLTVGKGHCIVGHFSAGANVWIRAGASVQYLDSMVGSKDTFVRNDNGDIRLVDHFHINKAPTASVEMIGRFSSDDNWQINSGTLILGVDSVIATGNRTPPVVSEKASLVLLSGSYFARRLGCDWGDDLIVKGKLVGGLPDRPLTSDARLGLGYKSKGRFLGSDGGARLPGPNDRGMVVAETGSITVYTSDPAKAALLINCSKLPPDTAQLEIISRGHPLHGDPLIEKMKTLPHLTDMVIKGQIDWRGLRLDDFLAGGIHVTALPPLDGKTGPRFGPNNTGKPAALFTVIGK